MSLKKSSARSMPNRSKVIVAVFGFLVTLYLLFVGFSYLKSWNDFKPYHKLAVELNESLGGGFSAAETKNCGIDASDCPSVHLVKTQNLQPAQMTQFIDAQRLYLSKNGYGDVKTGDCHAEDGYGYCFVSGIDVDSGLKVVISEKPSSIRVDIASP